MVMGVGRERGRGVIGGGRNGRRTQSVSYERRELFINNLGQ